MSDDTCIIYVATNDMARPIKETPVLTGQDAKKFIKAIEVSQTKKVWAEELARINSNYERLKAMAKPGTF